MDKTTEQKPMLTEEIKKKIEDEATEVYKQFMTIPSI